MPKQLKLELEENRIWEQMTEDAREECTMLLSRLIEKVWIETRGASNDVSREDL